MRRAKSGIAAISLGSLVAVGLAAAPAMAAPTPRLAANDCGFNAPTNQYRQKDPATNTECVTKKNGMFLFVKGYDVKRCQSSTFTASFKRITGRGDVQTKVRFVFVRGNTKVVRYISPNRKLRATTKLKFLKKGTWAVAATYKGERITTTVKVRPGGSC